MNGVDRDSGLRMHAERTPNPNSLKWVLGAPIAAAGVAANFEAAPPAAQSPLADALFRVEGVVGVFIASDFVTVSKREDIEWLEMAQPIVDALKALLGSGQPALAAAWSPAEASSEGEVAERVQQVIDASIRPAVARDGGDVVFRGFRDGVVELQMRGACSGCPSASATLQFAIEKRLCEEVPEVLSVVAV
jgi:Fe-S cluster biogenesis protein NfuA